MYGVRESWTDERLDDLNHRVEEGFSRVDVDIRDLKTEMSARFDRIDERFERIDERFERMHRLMLQSSVLVIAALIGLIATQL